MPMEAVFRAAVMAYSRYADFGPMLALKLREVVRLDSPRRRAVTPSDKTQRQLRLSRSCRVLATRDKRAEGGPCL
jgi:hypothetical protein